MTDAWNNERAWCWDVEKWALGPFARDQVVIHRASGDAVQVVDLNGLTGYYRLADGRWVACDELEDPLRDGRRRDLLWAQVREQREAAVRRGDFQAAFPGLRRAPAPAPAARGGNEPVLARLLLLHAMIVLGLVLSALVAPRTRSLVPPRSAPPAAAADHAPGGTSAADSGP